MRAYKFAKRLEDIVLSLFFIIILSPVYLIITVAMYFSKMRPIIFKQTRAGLNGKPFVIYKFTSMTNERGEDGELLHDFHRVTPLGKFLRKSSLDELPQFINVLKGDMSIVGPRPLLMEYNDLYSPEHALRLTVKPGITGLTQISGRSSLTWKARLDTDVKYVKKASFWQDQKIILVSFLKVVGAANSPAVTAPDKEIDDLKIIERARQKSADLKSKKPL